MNCLATFFVMVPCLANIHVCTVVTSCKYLCRNYKEIQSYNSIFLIFYSQSISPWRNLQLQNLCIWFKELVTSLNARKAWEQSPSNDITHNNTIQFMKNPNYWLIKPKRHNIVHKHSFIWLKIKILLIWYLSLPVFKSCQLFLTLKIVQWYIFEQCLLLFWLRDK